MSADTCTGGAYAAPSRHAATDARWYALQPAGELVLVYPDETYKTRALISARRALELIFEVLLARARGGVNT